MILAFAFAALASEEDTGKHAVQIGILKANKILFLGNSITLHGAKADIGWTGNWGMAASAQDKDYIHVLLQTFSEVTGAKPEPVIANIADFEREFAAYDIQANMKKHFDTKPDLVILAIGENVPALGSAEQKIKFKSKVLELLKALKDSGNPTIFVRSCFWPDQTKDEILAQSAAESGATFVDISAAGKDESNYARAERKIEHAGVAAHPGDKGMAAIADALWGAIKKKAGADAPANPPAKGAVSGDAQRYLQFNTWSAGSDLKEFEVFKQRIDLAKELGFNSVGLLIRWSDVEPAPGKFEWTGTDRNLDYVVSKGLKVTVNFIAWVSPSTKVVQESELMAGIDGKIFGMWDCNFISFASESAVKKVVNVFRAVAERYSKRHPPEAFLYYQVAFSCYTEDEYSPTSVLLDYSAAAKARFRTWLQQRYGDIAAVNAALQTKWKSFDELSPPPNHDGTVGLAWYLFRSEMLKQTLDLMADTVHAVDSHIKYGVQVGSVWDQSSASRATILFPSLCEKADWIIVDDAPNYNHRFSSDYLRSSAPGKKFANDFDAPSTGGANLEAVYAAQTQQSFEHGLHAVPVDNWALADLQKHPDFFKKLSALLAQPVPAIKAVRQMKVNASSILHASAPLGEYDKQSENGSKMLDVILFDDLSPALPPGKK